MLPVAVILALSASAGAQPGLVASTSTTTEPSRDTSVTTDGMVLVGIPDVTVESHVAPHVGVGGTLGGGELIFDPSIKVVFAGANANIYLQPKFSGWHVGSQAKYASVSGSDSMGGTTLFGTGLGVSAYAGYKWLRPSGFTAFVEAGIGATRAAVGDGSRTVAGTLVGPTTNLGIGYSF